MKLIDTIKDKETNNKECTLTSLIFEDCTSYDKETLVAICRELCYTIANYGYGRYEEEISEDLLSNLKEYHPELFEG